MSAVRVIAAERYMSLKDHFNVYAPHGYEMNEKALSEILSTYFQAHGPIEAVFVETFDSEEGK